MPEGPEVKTVAKTLAAELVGKELGALWHSDFRLRREIDFSRFKQFENKKIDAVSCYGKVIFIDVDYKPALMAQLGMTGQLTVARVREPLKNHTHIRWPLKNTDKEIRFVDPRRFGLVDICDEQQKQHVIDKLGPDPFSLPKTDFSLLIKKMMRSQRCIKEVLLDQSVICGVGNIYASEALFLSRIHPEKRAHEISQTDYVNLLNAVIDVLNQAFKNAGTTFSNYVDGDGNQGKNFAFLKVFRRENQPCGVCKTPILRIKQGGRSTFFCQHCQRM